MPEHNPWLPRIKSKILSIAEIRQTAGLWKQSRQKVVFTNGCFDLLHYGHIHYLSQAADLGDRLVIGLNSAASVSRLKGPNRPINDEETRKYLLASLGFVDAIVVFEEDTPYNLIDAVRPDVLVKGGDWTPDRIVGADLVMAYGGQVLNLPYIQGFSTTAIENKIIKSHQ